MERVVARYHRALPEFVWDAAVLENNPFTYPEVQTLLDGVTVGGHTVSDEHQVLRLADSTRELRRLVLAGDFALAKPVSDRLHRLVATGEALEAGHFRGEGAVVGDAVSVYLGEQGRYLAPDAGPGGSALRTIHAEGLKEIERIASPYVQALAYFAFGALQQFYFDGNKRTARLMMNGHLMVNGFDAISIPAARKNEFNQTMIGYFVSRDATALFALLRSCAPS